MAGARTPGAAAVRTVRVGFASFAHLHGWSYANVVRRLPGAEIMGLFDDDAARRKKMSASLDDAPAFESMAALLGEKPDAIVVASENARHREFTEAALDAGIPVLCEKPLASTLADGRAMVRKAKERGVAMATAFPCRFHPAAERACRAIRAGDIGALRAVSATNHGQVPPGWFIDPALSGGGAIMDHTVHVVDLLRWMTGAEIVSVYAEKGRLRDGIQVEDLGLVSMALSNGAVATLDASWSRPSRFPAWGDLTMEMIGSGGLLSLDLFAQMHSVHRMKHGETGPDTQWINWGDDMDRGLVTEFVNAVREVRPPSVTGEDGLAALEVTVAAYRSVERREAVSLPLAD